MKPAMISTPAGRAQVISAEPKWKTKFILRIVTMLFDFLSTVLAASVEPQANLFFAFHYIPLIISFFWCLANIVVRLVRARPMHPGANVAMDLLIWMGFFVDLFFDWFWAAYATGHNNYYYISEVSLARYKYAVRIQIAGLVFATFSLVLHFTLFIFACKDTSKRNKAEIETRRLAIAEKTRTREESRGRASVSKQSENLDPAATFGGYRARDSEERYDGIDIGSSSLGRPVSPLNSSGPPSPDRAHLSGPISPQRSSRNDYMG